MAAITWRFNAWAKYSNFRARRKNRRPAWPRPLKPDKFSPALGKTRVVLEGGSIDVNGQGTLLTTEECLLSKTQQRNPAMKRKDYEKIFAEYLGIKNVIWLGSGIAGDDTHGHVDDITRFVSPDTVVTAVESDPERPQLRAVARKHSPPARRHRSGRQAASHRRTAHARRRSISKSAACPPATRISTSPTGSCWSQSSTIPTTALRSISLADLFPDREVVGIYSGDLIWGFGAMHCMTQQQPAPSSSG